MNLFVRSMGPVDEGRQIFTLDCYFRQYWTDTRYRSSEQFSKETVPGRQTFTLDCYFRQYWTDTRYRTSEQFFKGTLPG